MILVSFGPDLPTDRATERLSNPHCTPRNTDRHGGVGDVVGAWPIVIRETTS